ncbi:MAG: RNA 2',3'-cyclic phosphodiesterase [Candidatus Dormibacteria bacterium]
MSAPGPTLFLAVRAPASVGARLAPLLQSLGALHPALRAVDPGGPHLTLRFLGHCPEEQLRLAERRAQEVAKRFQPFAVELGAWGCFPERGQPRVVWLGPARGREELGRLAQGLALEGERSTPFRPHLTLARLRGLLPGPERLRLQDLVQAWLSEVPPVHFRATALCLMESQTQAGGSNRYLTRRHWPLLGDG